MDLTDLSLDQFITRRLKERCTVKNNQSSAVSLNAKSEATEPPLPSPDLNEALSDGNMEMTASPFEKQEVSTGTQDQEPLVTRNTEVLNETSTSKTCIISTISNQEIGVDKDCCKSLDQIIIERSIVKPRRFNSTKRGNGSPTNRKPVSSRTISLRKDVDPLTSTLDQLIEHPRPKFDKKTSKSTVVRGVKRKYDRLSLASHVEGDRTFGKFLARPDVRIKMQKWPKGLTPYMAIGYLCEHGMMIEYRIGKLLEGQGAKDNLWQCEVSCGYISGRANSNRKVVAREVASKEFLRELQAEYPDVEIPAYEIPDGVFIDPKVKDLAVAVARSQGIPLQSETTIQKTDLRRRQKDDPEHVYVCTYFVGDEVIRGIHPNLDYATLEAAKMVWEKLTNESYRSTKFSVGDNCSGEFLYNFFETEVYNSLELNQVIDDDTDGDDDFLNEGFLAAVKSKEAVHESLKRRKVANKYKQKKKEEHDRRRNMEVDLDPRTYKPATSVSPKRRVTMHNVSEEVACSSSKAGVGRGRGRGVCKVEQASDSSSSSND
ncbi:hypothetical protein Ocin01_14077 [Orchesella cincta]|uniref:Uncharacterized protein n=1 Tax=Orchesella cincta TaxID=48709 RepID=A0A1D2MID7_ORCCI|nr:hypothetical protein Ocin01_14077 [Orchesella cincta]